MFGLGLLEAVVLAGLGIVVFGRNLPDVSRYVRRALREFRQGMNDPHDGNGPPMSIA